MQKLTELTSPDFISRIKNLASLHQEPLQGIDIEQIEKAEQRLGFVLPEPLKQLYLTVGQAESAMTAFHPFNTPQELSTYVGVDEDEHPDLTSEQLEALGGDLVFAFENQGCWAARYHQATGEVYFDLMIEADPFNKARAKTESDVKVGKSSELELSKESAQTTGTLDIDEDEQSEDIPPFYLMGTDLEGVILWILAQQCLNSDLSAGEFAVSAEEAPEFMQKLQQYFQAYTTGLESCLADVYFNPKQQIVVMLSKHKDGSYQGEIAVSDNEDFDELWARAEKSEDDTHVDNDAHVDKADQGADNAMDEDARDDDEEPLDALDDFAETMGIEISYF